MKIKTSVIHLGIYGKTAAKTIKLFIAGLREKISWQENNPVILGRKFTGDITDVQVDTTGEVILVVKSSEFTEPWRKYNESRIRNSAYANNLDTAFIKNWFGRCLAEGTHRLGTYAKLQLHPGSKASPTSRVWEVSATADALLGEDVEKTWGKAIFDRVVGTMADPVSTEIAEVVAEETKRISREYKQKHHEMHMKMIDEIADVRRKYKQIYAELGKQERAAITNMKKQMAAV